MTPSRSSFDQSLQIEAGTLRCVDYIRAGRCGRHRTACATIRAYTIPAHDPPSQAD